MMRVGYPDTMPQELLSEFPEGIELIRLANRLDHDVEIDVWIPDAYPSRAIHTWPQLRGVKLVLALVAGTEWLPDLVGPNITVCSGRGAHNTSTAEWTLTVILAMLKYLPLFLDIQRNGLWKRRFELPEHYAKVTGDTRALYPPVMLEELTGKTVLLVGYGSIGKDIEQLLAPFRVRIIRMARKARATHEVHAVSELDSLIPRADVIVLILPSTEETRHLIDAPQLALMRQGALLVNAARGPVVNTDALVAALNAGKIRAAIDVTDPEPLPEGHPLWSCPNLLITPHIGGSSPQFSPNAARIAIAELRRYMRGEPLENVVQSAV